MGDQSRHFVPNRLLVIGGAFVLHPVIGVYLTQLKARNFSAGAFVGFAAMNCINSLTSAIQWQQRVMMLKTLIEGGESSINSSLIPPCTYLSIALILYFVASLSLITILCYSHGQSSIFGPVDSGSTFSVGKTSDYYTLPNPSGDRAAQRLLVPGYENPFNGEEDQPLVSI